MLGVQRNAIFLFNFFFIMFACVLCTHGPSEENKKLKYKLQILNNFFKKKKNSRSKSNSPLGKIMPKKMCLKAS